MRFSACLPSSIRALAAQAEALDERLRQLSGTHTPLYSSNVVRNPPKLNCIVVEISDGEGRAGIAVAWLSDRPRVKEIAALRLDPQCGKGLQRTGTELQNFEIGILVGKPALVVGVAKKRQRGRGIEQAI